MPKTYSGRRENEQTTVTVSDGHQLRRRGQTEVRVLSPKKSLKVRNHSPSGFNWGYSGSGPAQLSLAILLDLHPEKGAEWAEDLHQRFKFIVVSKLDDSWTLTEAEIDKVIADIEAERPLNEVR